jgi:hypothetical protein
MRRNYWVVVANVAVLALAAGCRDTVVAPAAAPSTAPASAILAPSGAPSLSLTGGKDKNSSIDFTVTQRGGVFLVGNHAIVFPAQSICDPDQSSYGWDTWDDACVPLKRGIKIHATTKSLNGMTWVEFSPELRFVPSDDPARWVWLYMYTPQTIGATGDLSRFNILYAATIGGPVVNDAAGDPTLRTYVDSHTGISYRRVKHFSGYTSSEGRACDPKADTCGSEEPSTP